MKTVNVKYINKCTDESVYFFNKPCFIVSYQKNKELYSHYIIFNPQLDILDNIFCMKEDLFGFNGFTVFKSLTRLSKNEFEFVVS